MNKVLAIVFAGLLALSLSTPAFADDGGDNAMVTKLQRGSINTLTGVLEIPAQIQNEYEASESGIRNKTFALFGGLFKGIGMGVARTVGGIFEVVTFAMGDGEPLIEPETVFDNWD